MAKTLYSLMLSDEVVREVDRAAHRQGITRSALVNRLLAQALSVETPEVRINRIYKEMMGLLSEGYGLVPQFTPNQPTMALKSMLDYRYRPTVRYEVTLEATREEIGGVLSVQFRTQSSALLAAVSDFFADWCYWEQHYRGADCPTYTLGDLKVTRRLCLRENPYRPHPQEPNLAEALTAYIHTLDSAMKAYLAGDASRSETEAIYRRYLSSAEVLV